MFAAKALVRIAPSKLAVVPSRGINVISGPPRVRVSLAEKIGLGTGMVAIICAYPYWVITHLKDYKAPKA